jgi:hypothetical protein
MDTKFDFDMAERQANANLYSPYLADFKGEAYENINLILNLGIVIDRDSKDEADRYIVDAIQTIDQIIERAPRSNQTNILYRGLYDFEIDSTFKLPSNVEYPRIFDWYESQVGNCVLLRAFSSTSYTLEKAQNFSDGVILKFVIPPNFPMLAIDHVVHKHLKENKIFNCVKWEDEVLLPRGKFFYITSHKRVTIRHYGRDQTFLVLTLNPSPCKQSTPPKYVR